MEQNRPQKYNNYYEIRRTNVKGIIITDSFNNKMFPIPKPIYDDNKINLQLIYEQFKLLYGDSILPWHFVVEYYNRDYIIHNPRPIDVIYPSDPDMLYVMIIGDSSRDVYTRLLYKKIFENIIRPMSKLYKFTPNLDSTIHLSNLGKRFLVNELYHSIKL